MKPRMLATTLVLALAAPLAHATTYLSHYSGGGNYFYSPRGGGYIRSSLTDGLGDVDRTAAHPRTIIVATNPAPPCGNYLQRPERCRNITMAHNPNATVSRTGRRFIRPEYLRPARSVVVVERNWRPNWVTPQ